MCIPATTQQARNSRYGAALSPGATHHAVCAEITSPPTLEEVEQVLDLLQMPGLRYRVRSAGSWSVDYATWNTWQTTRRGPLTYR
ncbi:hypothetical protein [Nocardia sp. NPDC051463]|uniref:hypothetical protein n=1 Tax=Nocardia sp. NPDC051463 TaxID=3154845 RepID=UPI00341F9DD1